MIVQSIVDVSLFGSVGAGRSASSGDEPRENESVGLYPGSSINTLTFASGFAVERRLIDNLAVRLGATVLSASTSRAETSRQEDGEKKSVVTPTQAVNLSLTPALLLFFYF